MLTRPMNRPGFRKILAKMLKLWPCDAVTHARMPFTLFASPRRSALYETGAKRGLLRDWCCSRHHLEQEATDGCDCLRRVALRQLQLGSTASRAGDPHRRPGGRPPLAATQARPGADGGAAG